MKIGRKEQKKELISPLKTMITSDDSEKRDKYGSCKLLVVNFNAEDVKEGGRLPFLSNKNFSFLVT